MLEKSFWLIVVFPPKPLMVITELSSPVFLPPVATNIFLWCVYSPELASKLPIARLQPSFLSGAIAAWISLSSWTNVSCSQ